MGLGLGATIVDLAPYVGIGVGVYFWSLYQYRRSHAGPQEQTSVQVDACLRPSGAAEWRPVTVHLSRKVIWVEQTKMRTAQLRPTWRLLSIDEVAGETSVAGILEFSAVEMGSVQIGFDALGVPLVEKFLKLR